MVLTLPRDIAEEKVSHATEANRPLYFMSANNSSSLLFKNDTVIIITKAVCLLHSNTENLSLGKHVNVSLLHYAKQITSKCGQMS